MLGKCVICKTEIERVGSRKYCFNCKKEKLGAIWRINNQKRPKKDYTLRTCFKCKEQFYAKYRNAVVCKKYSCISYIHNLKRKILRAEKSLKLLANNLKNFENEYQDYQRAKL